MFAFAAALELLVWAGGGGKPGLGLLYLFWHNDHSVQNAAGFSVATLFGVLSFVGYLLDADEPWMSPTDPVHGKWRPALWYFSVTWGLLLVAFLLPAVLISLLRADGSTTDLTGWRRVLGACLPHYTNQVSLWAIVQGALAGVLVSLAVGWGLITLSGILTEKLRGWFDRNLRALLTRMRQELPSSGESHVMALAFFSLLLIAYVVLSICNPAFVIPAAAICILFGLLAGICGFAQYWVQPRHFGLLFLLVVVWVGINGVGRYRHQFRELKYESPNLVDLAAFDSNPPPIGEAKLLNNEELLVAWRTHQKQEKPKLVVVAASGGGLRAAVWSTTVLARLERDIPRFPYQVRMITGTSGGMLGAAYYAATLDAPNADGNSGRANRHSDLNDLVTRMAGDSLSAPARGLVLRDLPKTVLRFIPGDRGWAIEEAWEENTGGALCRPMRELTAGERSGWLPSLVFSPMMVEDGRRLIISNVNLDFLLQNHGAQLTGMPRSNDSDLNSLSAIQFFHLFPYAEKLRLSTASRMNASFPYITPAAELATRPSRRVVDAGYYDNYGVNVAALWLSHQRVWLKECLSGVVLVQIRDGASEYDRTHYVHDGETDASRWLRGLAWLTTPFSGFVSGRDSTMSFRNDEQVQALSEFFNHDPDQEFFTTVAFELSKPASLSWYLTQEEIEMIRSNMDLPTNPNDDPHNHNYHRVAELKKWLEP